MYNYGKEINNYDFLCVELCIENSKTIEKKYFIEIIDKYASISKIFLFNSAEANIYEYISEHENQHPMLMGQIIYINHSLDANNCGIINFESLSFGVETQFKINKKFNGCLYKKLWFIKKDDIEICKDCEFRYNCTDCRAFTIENNVYSKPLKCNYNPYTNEWN